MIPPAASTTTDTSPASGPELAPPERPASQTANQTVPAAETSLVEAELLVEEVSIDGMCGVY
jgi:mycofactocin precursor